jgi:hypothetical protein
MLDLRAGWSDLLERRSGLSGALRAYGRVFDAWADAPAPATPLDWTERECRRSWEGGIPLAVTAPPEIESDEIEDLLGLAVEIAADARRDAARGLGQLAAAWDRHEITPRSLLATPGRVAALDTIPDLDEGIAAFLAIVALRPSLETYLHGCRAHLRDADWDRGVCPFCGAPPGFAEVIEDGRRRLACHVCGGAWTFPRLRCPFCGDDATRNLGRLDFEAAADQGYFVSTCASCRGYIKELDQRVRWNGGPALIEDWGSPHVDLACSRVGYQRPAAPVILAARAPTS